MREGPQPWQCAAAASMCGGACEGRWLTVSGVDVYAMDDGGGVMVNEAASLSAFLQLFDPF